MKIALLTYSTKPRGSVVHTWELANALHQLGHTVCVYALDKDAKPATENAAIAPTPHRPLDCPTRLIPARPAPAAIDALIHQRIQEFVDYLATTDERYDIYHAQDCIGANALVQLREQGRVPPIVRTVHHVEDYESVYLRDCQDKSIRLPDLCLCVSDRWQQALRRDYGIQAPPRGERRRSAALFAPRHRGRIGVEAGLRIDGNAHLPDGRRHRTAQKFAALARSICPSAPATTPGATGDRGRRDPV